MAGQWRIERSTGAAAEFHHRPLPVPLRPTVWIHQVERPALVLGSRQIAEGLLDVDGIEASGHEVCQRRSGGGLVFVEPGGSCWVDLLLPPDHARWNDDVGRAFEWVGEAWMAALRSIGVLAEISVHRGALLHPAWGRQLCFAGLGPGEVSVAGHKTVGLSQRRTREGARFQCLAVADWDPAALRRLLRPGALLPDLDESLDSLRIGWPVDTEQLADAFVEALPPA